MDKPVDLEQTQAAVQQRNRQERIVRYGTFVLFLITAAMAVMLSDSMRKFIAAGPSLENMLLFFPPLALGLVGLFIVFRIMGRQSQQEAARQSRQNDVLREVAAISEETPARVPFLEKRAWLGILTLVLGAAVLGGVLYWLTPTLAQWQATLQSRRPEIPSQTLYILAGVAIILVLWGGQQAYRYYRYQEKLSFAPLGRVLFGLLIYVAMWGLFKILQATLSWLGGDDVVSGDFSILILLIELVLAIFAVKLVSVGPFQLIQERYWRADYASALRRARFLQRLAPHNPTFVFLESAMHLAARNYPEAERLLQHCLEQSQEQYSGQRATVLGGLGEVALAQRRYADAITYCEGVIKISPESATAYRSLANIYLEQNDLTARALDLTTQALAAHKVRKALRRSSLQSLAEIYGVRAWALSRLGRNDEAAACITRAFELGHRRSRPGMAYLHYLAGQALRAQREESSAVEHFNAARRLDPEGYYGELTTRALGETGQEKL